MVDLIRANDLEGVYAIIPTPAREGADHWSATDTIDLAESERLVNQLIADGASGLIALGTTGECATLTTAEYRSFVDVVLSTVAGRIPTFMGATALGTHEIVERLRFVRDQGATGTLLGLPMWQPLTEDMAVRFFADMSEACPDLAIMVYMNLRAFHFEFPISFWERVAAEAPTVVAAKYARGPYKETIEATGGRINLLPVDMAVLPMSQLAPENVTACWSTASSMGPQPVTALMKAIAAKDMERAKEIDADIKWANETFIPSDPVEWNHFNLQLEKLRMGAAGYCKPGPIRPPYHLVPDHLRASAAESGQRWAKLVEKYSK